MLKSAVFSRLSNIPGTNVMQYSAAPLPRFIWATESHKDVVSVPFWIKLQDRRSVCRYRGSTNPLRFRNCAEKSTALSIFLRRWSPGTSSSIQITSAWYLSSFSFLSIFITLLHYTTKRRKSPTFAGLFRQAEYSVNMHSKSDKPALLQPNKEISLILLMDSCFLKRFWFFWELFSFCIELHMDKRPVLWLFLFPSFYGSMTFQ